MKLHVFDSVEGAARAGAEFIAAEALDAIDERGKFVMAVSGGRTPWAMLRALATMDLPWANIHVAQVDERVAPEGDEERNLTHLRESVRSAPIPASNIHAMPVEADELDAAAGEYEIELKTLAGDPPVLDLVHLGLGADGHTASLVPGDSVLEVTARDVAMTGVYQGRRRMTLTYPIINRARRVLWIVTGAEKADMLSKLLEGDAAIPAGRVESKRGLVIADRDAGGRSSRQSD